MGGVEHLIIGVGLILETSSPLDGVPRAVIRCSLQGKRVSAQMFGHHDTFWVCVGILCLVSFSVSVVYDSSCFCNTTYFQNHPFFLQCHPHLWLDICQLQ
jgi:hypothetical protein